MTETAHARSAPPSLASLLRDTGLNGEENRPRVALVAGSGMSATADRIEGGASIGFGEIEGLGSASVAGHEGRWFAGRLAGTPVHFLAGRRHYYEGVDSATVVHAIRMLASLGVRLVILTNAAGGLSPHLKPGDLMMIHDQINLSFRHPLIGPNDDHLGPRFPDMCDAFDPAARAIVRKRAQKAGIPLEEGVYAQVLGPNYETPAEIDLLRRVGAHAVGMSTVPEVLAARHAGMRVLAFSMITNSCLGKGPEREATSHAEVLQVAGQGRARLERLFEATLPSLERVAHSPVFKR